MTLFCPNCSCPLEMGEGVCPKCGALFGPNSTWLPTLRPRGPVPARPGGLAVRSVEAPSEEGPRQKPAEPTESFRPAAGRQRLYGLVVACVAIACLVYAFRDGLAQLLALSVPSGARERVAWMYAQTILAPMAQPAQPLPALAINMTALGSSVLMYYSLVALVLLQVALLLRRIVICVAERKVVAPSGLTRIPKVLLFIGLTTWCIAILVEFSPRLLVLLVGRPIPGLGLTAGVIHAFILPFIWIPALNFIGPVFFALELHSVSREGLRPRNRSKPQDLGPPRTEALGRSKHA